MSFIRCYDECFSLPVLFWCECFFALFCRCIFSVLLFDNNQGGRAAFPIGSLMAPYGLRVAHNGEILQASSNLPKSVF